MNILISLLIVFVVLVIDTLIIYIITKIVLHNRQEQYNLTNIEIEKYKQDNLQSTDALIKKIKENALNNIRNQCEKEKKKYDSEILFKLNDIKRKETRLNIAQNNFNKKELIFYNKQKNIADKEKEINKQKLEIETILSSAKEKEQSINIKLQQISNYTKEEAKTELLKLYINDAKMEFAKNLKQLEEEAKEKSDTIAKKIILSSMQQCCVNTVCENTLSIINIDNNDLKACIIGKNGRNLHAFENATGTEILIDDTPGIITISCFDAIRREIAKNTLKELIIDGRIQPARIEEYAEKNKKEMQKEIIKTGENAILECGIFDLHKDLIEIIGKLKYRTSYGQNMLQHSLEVAFLSYKIGAELGVNANLCKRAGFLHDIGKAIDAEVEGTHSFIGGTLVKRFGENDDVANIIFAHHNEIQNTSFECEIVKIADTISSARPGARRESLELYLRRLDELEKIPKQYKEVKNCYVIQSGREIRVLVKPELVDDKQMNVLALNIKKDIEKNIKHVCQIKINIIRETRCTETVEKV